MTWIDTYQDLPTGCFWGFGIPLITSKGLSREAGHVLLPATHSADRPVKVTPPAPARPKSFTIPFDRILRIPSYTDIERVITSSPQTLLSRLHRPASDSASRQLEEAVRRLDGRVERASSLALQCSEGTDLVTENQQPSSVDQVRKTN